MISPIKCDFFENAWKSVKDVFTFEDKPYIPQNSHNATFIESAEINYLDEIKLNTTEWKCIDQILRNSTNVTGNFTSLLLYAVNETVVDQIKDCYADKSAVSAEKPTDSAGIDFFGWWDDFVQTDFWKFITEHYWYILIAAGASLVVILCLCKLCCAICKKKHDDDIVE